MKVHSFQHVPYEGLDRISDWAAARGHQASATRFYAGDALPKLSDIELLIIMGGPMGVYEAADYPWMTGEMRFIKEAIEGGKRVLGICLGSQLIAGALGARVYPHTQKEIGWWPVRFDPLAQATALSAFGPEAMLYHWHGDTFDLPKGAALLASSEACRHQAFKLGTKTLALQFHPEISFETIGRWVKESGSIKNAQGFIQSEETMKQNAPAHLARLEKTLPLFLDRFTVA